MFDINPLEIVAFARQASGAVAGAAGLHGWLFYNRSQGKFAKLLTPLIIGSSLVYIAAWSIGFLGYNQAHAHVGISLEPTLTDIAQSYAWQIPLMGVLLVLLAATRWGLTRAPRVIYFLYFIVLSLLISTYAISDSLDPQQISYIWHGWHSILTLGTVIVLDYLFFTCRHDRALLAKFHWSFNRFTLLILTGLLLDVLSTYLILDEALRLNARFFFVQTIVGILLINGIILAEPLTRKATVFLASKRALPKPLNAVLGLAGAISFVSWNTITFLDFVPDISLSYGSLATIYLAVIACGFMGHLIMENVSLGVKPGKKR